MSMHPLIILMEGTAAIAIWPPRHTHHYKTTKLSADLKVFQ